MIAKNGDAYFWGSRFVNPVPKSDTPPKLTHKIEEVAFQRAALKIEQIEHLQCNRKFSKLQSFWRYAKFRFCINKLCLECTACFRVTSCIARNTNLSHSFLINAKFPHVKMEVTFNFMLMWSTCQMLISVLLMALRFMCLFIGGERVSQIN